jgi:3-phenylpropionate/cinnamic acid dioxygenase small subunit
MRRGTIVVALLALQGAAGVASAREPSLSTRDYIEIQQLYARYVTVLDQGRAEEYAGMFTADGEFARGRAAGHANDDRTPIKGTKALIDYVRNVDARHFITNIVITPTREGAKGSCYLLLYSKVSTSPTMMETAIYEDQLVRTAKGWKFTKRTVWRDDDDLSPFRPKPLQP